MCVRRLIILQFVARARRNLNLPYIRARASSRERERVLRAPQKGEMQEMKEKPPPFFFVSFNCVAAGLSCGFWAARAFTVRESETEQLKILLRTKFHFNTTI